ncbi:Imelysin [Flavobacterium columnare]|uniref:Imelysin n=2 Tax=Flavobacterium TaxID=237 RepID=A0A2N9PEF9_9FLAO|nr:imelysin family protein [Flavobacterium columnare]RVU90249.1 iron-regulated protein A precursor [Flavobacterium columnare]SPE78703.1 Imelysin [Flavobacterium columnare]
MRKIFFVLFLSLLTSCSDDKKIDEPQVTIGDNYDKKAMLTNWAENIIIPAYKNYQIEVNKLYEEANSFKQNPTTDNLNKVRTSWFNSYKAYQRVAMFKIGKSEDLYFVNHTNTYPVNVIEINKNINTEGYNLTSLTQFDKQGYPALDYMLYGLADTDNAILMFYTGAEAQKYATYLTALVTDLKNTADSLLNDWNTYKNTFISNTNNTSSGSVNLIVNAYIEYFEKHIRLGKVGYPAGKFSSGVQPNKVEGYFKKDISKILLNEAVKASADFFNGKYFASNQTGPSLKSYLDHLNVQRNNKLLSTIINDQFSLIQIKNNALDNNFVNQISTDNNKMLEAYDAMQINVSYFKVDMLTALNIAVGYVDSDGD